MLEVIIPKMEIYDEEHSTFIYIKEQRLELEHSLVSLSKWESKWHKPFIGNKELTREESIDYVRCMTINIKHVDPRVYIYLPQDIEKRISDYIANPMTATWFNKQNNNKPLSRRAVTNELIYYWMIEIGIPVEFEKWHLNRLMTLIEVCNEERKPKKKSTTNALIRDYAAINKANRAKFNSKG